MVYHVKNIKGPVFPSQAIVLRGSGLWFTIRAEEVCQMLL